MVKRAVHRKFHVAGTRSLRAGGRDLLGNVGRRNDFLGERDAVVGQERHLDQLVRPQVVVDHFAEAVDQLDDHLRDPITRRGLARHDVYARHRRLDPVLNDLEVLMHDSERHQQLTFVLVDALGLHVEDRSRIDVDVRDCD